MVIRSLRQPLSNCSGSEAAVMPRPEISLMPTGSEMRAAKRRSVVAAPLVPVTVRSMASPESAGNISVLMPRASGSGTETVFVVEPAAMVTSVMVPNWADAGWRMVKVVIARCESSGMCSEAPSAAPNGDIHDVDGSPSVAAHPPIAGTPAR